MTHETISPEHFAESVYEYIDNFDTQVEILKQQEDDDPVPVVVHVPNDPKVHERGFVGAMWVKPDAMIEYWRLKVAHIENPGEKLFRFDETRSFFKTCLRLHKAGLPINHPTMAKECTEDELIGMGSLWYALQHLDYYFCVQHSKQHLDAMIRDYALRNYQDTLDHYRENAVDSFSLNSNIATLKEQLSKLLKADVAMITPSVERCVDTMERLIQADADGGELPSHFREFAGYVGEYKRGQITLIGAPPGNGKTAFAMQEIEHMMNHGFVCDAFLLESSFDQFSERYLMRNYQIRGGAFKRKFFTQDQLRDIQEGMEKLNRMEKLLFMSPMGNFSAADIDAMIQERKNATGLPCDFIVIDHLNTMTHPQHKGQSQYDAVKSTVHQLREIAVRENAAMLVMDQLTVEAIRNSFNSKSRLPSIGAFRGGTAVESAKVVAILHKDEQAMLEDAPVVEQQIVICKANDGQTGFIRSLFLKPFAMHIEDVNRQQRHQYSKWLNALNYDLDIIRKDVK